MVIVLLKWMTLLEVKWAQNQECQIPGILYLECKNQTVRKHIAGVTYGETISAAAAKSLPLLAANCTMSGLSAKIIHCKWKKNPMHRNVKFNKTFNKKILEKM